VTRSSNPEGRAVQSARDDAGRQVDEVLLREIGGLNHALAAEFRALLPASGNAKASSERGPCQRTQGT
jgi:hypothetical protein